ncbi:MAG: DUF3107 domain-containing protein [Actinomycetota bacterium]|nr:DUF3107 domain-containing protein [Actinomycetota bacterium]
MEVRIGVVYTARELVVDTEDSADAVAKAVDAALGGKPMLWLTDAKGRRVGVPSDKIAFVEFSSEAADRQVGFGKR